MITRPGNFPEIVSEEGCFTTCCLPGQTSKTSSWIPQEKVEVSWRFMGLFFKLVCFQRARTDPKGKPTFEFGLSGRSAQHQKPS